MPSVANRVTLQGAADLPQPTDALSASSGVDPYKMPENLQKAEIIATFKEGKLESITKIRVKGTAKDVELSSREDPLKEFKPVPEVMLILI